MGIYWAQQGTVDEQLADSRAAVRADDFGPFVATLAFGAVLSFEGMPMGPFEGAAYSGG